MIVEIEKTNGLATYEVPYFAKEITVMDILDYIYANLDHDLSYFKHSTCNQAVCARCMCTMNGTPVLSCAQIVHEDTPKIHLGPFGGPVVKDLVVKRI